MMKLGSKVRYKRVNDYLAFNWGEPFKILNILSYLPEECCHRGIIAFFALSVSYYL